MSSSVPEGALLLERFPPSALWVMTWVPAIRGFLAAQFMDASQIDAE